MKARIDVTRKPDGAFTWQIRVAREGRYTYAVVAPPPEFIGWQDYDRILKLARRVAKQLNLEVEE